MQRLSPRVLDAGDRVIDKFVKMKAILAESEGNITNKKENVKEITDLILTTKHVMLGQTPSIQYIWRTNNG